MRTSLVSLLSCPVCGGQLELLASPMREEVGTGDLRCSACAATYPVVRGIPRMNAEMERLEAVARTFTFEWRSHHDGQFEQETLFGRTMEQDWDFFLDSLGIGPEDVRGAIVLDAGCGSGRFVRLAAEAGAAAAIGLDINDAVEEAFAHCRRLNNAHIVQGNVFAPPFKPAVFDLIWCNGVLHHTPDPARGHRSLSRHVKPGGTLFVWVYAKRFNPFRFVKTVFDALRLTRLPEGALLRLSKAIAYPSLALLHVYRALRRLPGLKPRTAWGARTVRRRNLREVQLTWFDALSPEYDSRHSEEEVVGWFARNGFTRITAIEEPKVGVRGVASSTGAGPPSR